MDVSVRAGDVDNIHDPLTTDPKSCVSAQAEALITATGDRKRMILNEMKRDEHGNLRLNCSPDTERTLFKIKSLSGADYELNVS